MDYSEVNKQMKISRWKEAFRLPPNYASIPKLKCDEKDVEVFKELKALKEGRIVPYVEAGRCLYIYGGTPGTGKTSWAVDIAKTYYSYCRWQLNKGYEPPKVPVVFIDVNSYLELQKASFDDPDKKAEFEQLKSDALEAKLLILDDIGYCQSYSEYDENTLSSLINKRMNIMTSITIFTSNRSPGDLKRVINVKTCDRIFSKRTKVYHIKSTKSKR